jgi:1,3-beta-galactosyl-N-acetylhexosamine phosphorylase
MATAKKTKVSKTATKKAIAGSFVSISVPKGKGGITLPAETGCEEIVKKLCKQWGADYIRDSDGTTLSPELLQMGFKIYSTICLVRDEQKWPRQHMDQLPQKFLMSDPVTATDKTVAIKPMGGFYAEKYVIDTKHDPKKWWEVIDRTAGKVIPTKDWSLDKKTETVTIKNASPYHVYTVNFLVYQIWDTTSMYNHLTNNWDRPHVISVDPYHKECWDHLMKYFDKWMDGHKETDLVRLTTLAYHFAVDSDQTSADKFRDWTGYQDTISVPALEDFEKEYGYKLTAEDFVDQGYYNATIRVPSEKFLDWMEFIHKFVVKFGKALCDKSHKAGKTTGMFWGDHWIGTEPYLDSFEEMGIDVHIGACEDGVALRRIADTPGKHTRECRLYPYFFPDVFHEGGDPLTESQNNWTKIRRALLRKPIDRIGYGGYLSLAAKFPKFVTHVGEICDEFRAIKEMSGGAGSWKQPIKVAVLSAWGQRRSWLPMHGPAQKFMVMRADAFWVAGSNLLECLSGLPVEVSFISCADIAAKGVPMDVDVVINDGAAETAWSGGRMWEDPNLLSEIRAFVARGGGFIGCRGPSAQPFHGHYFQLFDVMGVEKEIGWSLQSARAPSEKPATHFITDDCFSSWDFGSPESWVFSCDRDTKILVEKDNHIMVAVKDYFKGRSVYFSGLPFSFENSRLLFRSILWAAGKEKSLKKWFSDNLNCEVAAFPKKKIFAVVNNSAETQSTTVFTDKGSAGKVTLKPREMKWFKID